MNGKIQIVLALGLATYGLKASELKVYFGNLHSHTSYSDGSGTPREAFKYARYGKLDFLAITEHNHKSAMPDTNTPCIVFETETT